MESPGMQHLEPTCRHAGFPEHHRQVQLFWFTLGLTLPRSLTSCSQRLAQVLIPVGLPPQDACLQTR